MRQELGFSEDSLIVSTIGASFYIQREAGTLTVTARSTAGAAAAIEAAVLEETARLGQAPVEEAELARALTGVEAGYAFGHETAEGLAYSYGLAETVWTLEFELGYLDAVRRVTREAMRDAARRHLRRDRFTGAAIGPGDVGASAASAG